MLKISHKLHSGFSNLNKWFDMTGADYNNFDLASQNCTSIWSDFLEFLSDQFFRGNIKITTSWEEIQALWYQQKLQDAIEIIF